MRGLGKAAILIGMVILALPLVLAWLPSVTINSPLNRTTGSNILNVTATGFSSANGYIWYSLDGNQNITILSDGNLADGAEVEMSLTESQHNIVVWANDSSGNIGSSTTYPILSTSSYSFDSPSTSPKGVAWNGTNLISSDIDSGMIYVHEGISSTIIESFSNPFNFPSGLTWNGTNLISCDNGIDKIYVHEGISSTIIESFDSPYWSPNGLAYDGTNLISADAIKDKVYVHNGVSSSILYSFDVHDLRGITWNGTNLIVIDWSDNTLYVYEGLSDVIIESFPLLGTRSYDAAWNETHLIVSDDVGNKIYVYDSKKQDVWFTYNTTYTCGNGVCESYEHGYTCFADCHPESILLIAKNITDSYQHISEYIWNGTSYVRGDNLTVTDGLANWHFPAPFYKTDETAIAVSHVFKEGINAMRDMWFTEYDGSSWSYPSNITHSPTRKAFQFGTIDMNSSEDIMMVWQEESDDLNNIHWTSYSGVVPSPAQPIVDTNVDQDAYALTFAFAPNDEGYALFANISDNQVVKYIRWDGSEWGSPATLKSYDTGLAISLLSVDFASNGSGIAAWIVSNETAHWWLQYATYNGSDWTYQGNFSDSYLPLPASELRIAVTILSYDQNDVPMMTGIYVIQSPIAVWSMYHRYVDGQWESPQEFEGVAEYSQTFPLKSYDGTLFAISMDFWALQAEARSEWRWAVWDGSEWSDFAAMGEEAGADITPPTLVSEIYPSGEPLMICSDASGLVGNYIVLTNIGGMAR